MDKDVMHLYSGISLRHKKEQKFAICSNTVRIGWYYAKVRASLIAQLVKDLPSMQETPVQFLGWEVLLEKG